MSRPSATATAAVHAGRVTEGRHLEHNGLFSTDLSRHHTNLGAAMRTAAHHNQTAIYDLANRSSVFPSGGTWINGSLIVTERRSASSAPSGRTASKPPVALRPARNPTLMA